MPEPPYLWNMGTSPSGRPRAFGLRFRFGPADGYRPLSPSRAKSGGESPVPSRIPFGVRRGAALSSALPKPRLCRQGDPPHRPSLTALPPFQRSLCPVDRVRSNQASQLKQRSKAASHDYSSQRLLTVNHSVRFLWA